jgi:hypothetical protein
VLSANAIPTVYTGKGVTGIAFGENAYALSEEAFEKGLIIDALAAKILSDRGIDVGVKSFGGEIPVKYQYIKDTDNYIIAGYKSVFAVELAQTAKVMSYGAQDFDKLDLPFCYQYENGKGQRFLVFNCIGKDCEMLLKHHANAKMIADSVEWLSGNKLPAFCYGNPNLYMQCKEDENALVVGLWNFFEDEVIEPVIELGQAYQSAEFLCGQGSLYEDTVRLDDIPPFGFRAIVLSKK